MSSEKMTPTKILLPVLLLSVGFVSLLGFQTHMLSADRTAIDQTYTQQEKTLEQVEKVKTQVNALAKGTLTLAEQGNKNARAIVDQMKKAGIEIQPPQQGQAPAEAGMAPPPPAQP